MVIGSSHNRRPGAIGDDGDIFFTIDKDECPLTPAVGCVTPTQAGASRLVLRNSGGARDQFVWKWKKGGATVAGDLGDPTSTADCAVCLCDKVPAAMRPVLEKHARASGVCNGLPCWSAGGAGYKYRDSKSERGAIRNLTIQSGEAGRSSLSVRAMGPTLALPVLPLAKNPSAKAQLINLENGKCWEATFSTLLSNDTARFKARSD